MRRIFSPLIPALAAAVFWVGPLAAPFAMDSAWAAPAKANADETAPAKAGKAAKPAQGKSGQVKSDQTDAAGEAKGFDAEAFQKNFVAGLSGRTNAPAMASSDVRVLQVEKAAPFGGTVIYLVRGELAPKGGQAQPFTLFVSADGRFYVSDIIELSKGKSLLKDAREKMRAADLQTLGHTLTTGTGKATVVYVSDPFCPYCRTAFSFLMGKSAAFGEFRLAHFPLSSHPGADIACALMAWAADKAPQRALEFARFAYTELPAPSVADKSAENMQKAWNQVAEAFLARFPELQALGADGAAIVDALGGSAWDAAVREDMAKAAGMDINGTPVIFVDGARVDGFDQTRLGALLK